MLRYLSIHGWASHFYAYGTPMLQCCTSRRIVSEIEGFIVTVTCFSHPPARFHGLLDKGDILFLL